MIIEDMKDKLDLAQYGNQKGLSIQHYLIIMIHRILTSLDNNSKGDIFAAIASLIDWKQAFNRQNSTLGIHSFIYNGVRPALIPMLINYFQKRNVFFLNGKGSLKKLKIFMVEGPRKVFLDSSNIFPNPMIIVIQLSPKINLNLLMTLPL